MSKKRPFKTAEVKTHFIPNTVSFESYMYGLDKRAVIDPAVCDIVEEAMARKGDDKNKEKEEIEKRELEHERKLQGYMTKVREMVR